MLNQFDRSLKPIPNKLTTISAEKRLYNFSPKSPYNRQQIPQLVKYNPAQKLKQKQKNKLQLTHFNYQDQQNFGNELNQNANNQFLLLDRSFVQSEYISKTQQSNQQEQIQLDKNIKFSFGGTNKNYKQAKNISKIQELILNKYKKDQKIVQIQKIVKNQQEQNTQKSRFPKREYELIVNKLNISEKNQKNKFNLNLSKNQKIAQFKDNELKNNTQKQEDHYIQLNLKDSRAQNQQIEYINDQILDTIYAVNRTKKTDNNLFLTQQHTINSIDASSNQNQNQLKNSQTVNPLNLLHYSLHNNIKPTFIQDEIFEQKENKISSEQKKLKTVVNNQINSPKASNNIVNQSHIRWINTIDLNKFYPKQNDKKPVNSHNILPHFQQVQSEFHQNSKQYEIIQKAEKNVIQTQENKKVIQTQQKEIELQKISLSLFSYYLGNKLQAVYNIPFVTSAKKQNTNQINNLYESYLIEQDHEEFNEKHINQFIPANQIILNTLTSRSTPPVQNNTSHSSPYKILDKSYQSNLSGDYFRTERNQEQNFILDKKPEQILSSIITNRQKLKLYLKYLQCQIAQQSQNSSTKQVYQILSCLLIKLNSINQNSTKQRQNILTQTILKMFDKNQKSKQDKAQISLKPTISLSQKGIKIEFDKYLSHQRKFLNERITYLKSVLQQKKSEQQLIKLSYDQVIHNYAQSLSNVAKSKQFFSKKSQNQQKIKETVSEPEQNMRQYMQAQRDSLKVNHKMYRKATFGKAPSSMRNSNQNQQI